MRKVNETSWRYFEVIAVARDKWKVGGGHFWRWLKMSGNLVEVGEVLEMIVGKVGDRLRQDC